MNAGFAAAAMLAVAALCAGAAAPAARAGEFIVVQSTTSTRNTGLLDHLLPEFTARSGIEVRVVAVGTGQALGNARNGDGDVLLVHAKPAEEKFVADGYGVERFDLMYNDFVIVGPAGDPAGVAGMRDAVAGFARIARAGAAFASRGDDSGTHRKELGLWKEAGIDPAPASGAWYRETGSGMGATLNLAVGMGAYALTDRATWTAFANKGDFTIHVEGDARLFNQYGVILVDPRKHPHVKAAAGQAFIDWLLGPEGQRAIASFRVAGRQLFFPNAAGSAAGRCGARRIMDDAVASAPLRPAHRATPPCRNEPSTTPTTPSTGSRNGVTTGPGSTSGCGPRRRASSPSRPAGIRSRAARSGGRISSARETSAARRRRIRSCWECGGTPRISRST